MSVRYEVDAGANVVRIRFRGEVTREDFDAFFAAAEQDLAFHRHLHRLLDASEATAFPDSDAIRDVAHRVRARGVSDESRIAVVTQSPLGAGIMAMILGGAGLSGQYEVFEDLPAAEAWLGSESQTAWREFLDRTEGLPPRPRTGGAGGFTKANQQRTSAGG